MSAPTKNDKGRSHLLVAIAMALFATIEVFYEWSSVLRDAKRTMTSWWDDLEHHEHEAAFQAGMRWLMAAVERRGQTSGLPDADVRATTSDGPRAGSLAPAEAS
jgi:hypothetical protein